MENNMKKGEIRNRRAKVNRRQRKEKGETYESCMREKEK